MTNDWIPHPKQAAALERPEYEILYGGARGGGKTDSGLVWLIGERYDGVHRLLEHPRYRALVIRKNAEDLSDWIDRAYRFYSGFGVDIAYKPAVLRFPSGAVIRTGHLKDDQSYTKYMGQEFPRMLIEELTQIPFEKRYLQLIASCRSTIPDIKPQIFATTNPGGLGHGWVKKRFVDPAPAGQPFKDITSGRTRIYIPATVDDNPTLQEADPDYVKSLDALKETDEDLWKAWRLGDWNTFAGQYFREWRTALHVIPSFMPDKKSVLVGGLDWGRSKPFSFHLAEISKIVYDEKVFYRTKVFLEAYGTEKTPDEWTTEIKEKLKFFNLTIGDISWVSCDTQIFAKGIDPKAVDIYTQFWKADEGWKAKLKRANKDRIGGWSNFHNWLSIAPDGLPYLQYTNNCHNAIRTIPELVHDEYKVEDVNTEGEDHAGDDGRYMCYSLKWIDGHAGGVRHTPLIVNRTAQFIGTKQVGVDLDKWNVPIINQSPTVDNGVGGVRRA